MKRFLGVFLYLTAVAAFAEHDGTAPKSRSLNNPLALPYALQCTPLDELLQRNGALPKKDEDWDRLFKRIDSTGPDIYFSESKAHTSLLNPRRIYMAATNKGEGVKGGSFFGRVFVALGKNDEGHRIAEFITATPSGHGFLFGTIDPTAQPPIRVESMLKCKECHKTEGLEYTIYPWTNSSANINNPVALVHRLAEKDPRQYAPVLAEVNRILSQAKTNASSSAGTQPRTSLKGFDDPRLLYPSSFEDYSPPSGGTERKFIEEAFAQSAILQNAKYQGVPIFRNQMTRGYGGTGASLLHEVVEKMGGPLAFAQVLEFLPRKERATYIRQGIEQVVDESLITNSIIPATVSLPSFLEGKRLPAVHSSLTLDSDAVKNEVFHDTGIDQINTFYYDLVHDPRRLDRILGYDSRREKQAGRHPGTSAFKPADSKQYDSRGVPEYADGYESTVGKLSTIVQLITAPYILEKEPVNKNRLHPFGLTVADFDYFKQVSESHHGDLQAVVRHALDSRWMKDLYARNTIPARSQLKVAFMKGMGDYFLRTRGDTSVMDIPESDYLSDTDRGCLSHFRSPAPPGEACVRCHGSEDPITRYVGNLKEWKERLDAKDPEAMKYAGKIKAYLSKNQMPPPHSPESFQFEGSDEQKNLAEFLRPYSWPLTPDLREGN